jgi:hypothetical protein
MLKSVYPIIIVFALTSWIPSIVYGDIVTGKVNPVPSNHQFIIVTIDSDGNAKEKTVTTDLKGNFEVTLPPGVYTAKSDARQATIRSSNRPLLGQVINFEKKNSD